jgi:uncharacterized protein YciI
MPFLIYAVDHEGRDTLRESLREAHRTHLRSAGSSLLASGALLADDHATVIGGISLLDTEHRAEAELFAAADPFAKAGLRRETHVIYWRRRWWEGSFLPDQP